MRRNIFFGSCLSLLAALALSCADADEEPSPASFAGILEAPAYAGITDSIRKNPEDWQLYMQRASRLSGENQHEVASPDYKKAWELSGNEEVALEYTSNLLLLDRVQEAVDLLTEGTARFPENSEFNRRLAELHVHLGRSDLALEQYRQMLAMDSTNFEAWYDLGMLQARLKDTTAALHALETSFTLLPIRYSGLALASLYAARKDARALEVCEVLMARDSAGSAADVLLLKGIYHAETGNDAKAIACFDECIRQNWQMTDAYLEKGILLLERDRTQEALRIFEMAMNVSATDPDVYYWIGRCLEKMGNREEAKKYFQRAFALDNGFAEALEALQRMEG